LIARLAAVVFLALAAAGAQAVSLPQGCDRAVPLSATQQDRLLRFAAVIKQALDDSGAGLALVARSGTDLSRFGLRYSHAGIALREGLDSPWAVRQLYFACTEGQARLFDQGMAGFVSGSDDAANGFVSVLLLPPEAALALARATLDTPLAMALLEPRYSANAYPFSLSYQNCNQWVAELLAASFGAVATREQAQAWLRAAGYAPEPVRVASAWLMLAGRFVPWLHFDDHPTALLGQRAVQTSLPESLEAFAQQRWPEARRIEFCHGPQGVVWREGFSRLAAGCVAQPEDRVLALD
jgi:hypothetical protein